MTLLLGLIAVVLLAGIIVAVMSATRDDEVLGFTRPEDLKSGNHAAMMSPPPRPVTESLVAQTSPDVGATADPDTDAWVAEIIAERAGSSSPTAPLSSFYPGNLGVGTKLTYRGIDSTIIGVLNFGRDEELWQDYLAEHAAGAWWRFGVEPDRGMKLAAFEPRDLGVQPGPETIVYDGQAYTVTESGQATFRSAGTTHQAAHGMYRYYDYENNARVILSFEKFDDGPWLTSIGHHVDPNAVQVCNALPPAEAN